MSSKQNKPQQQQQQQKRKADAPAAQPQQPKKQKDQNGAAAAAPQQQGKKPQQAAAQPKGQQQAAGKKGKKAEPEPEPESEEEDEEGNAPDEEALKAIEALQPEQDAITAELDAFDEQQNAEIYAIQKKYLLKKRPILAKRDALVAKLPNLWKTLLTEHEVFAVQLEEIDVEILDNLSIVEVSENYSPPTDPKQQIVSIAIAFTFSAGNKHVKAGKYTKTFKFNDEKEGLEGVAVPAAKLPFTSPKFSEEHKDSFFVSWFTSEGDDEGILAAQDALTSELYVDPLQLYAHVAGGGSLKDLQADGDDDDDDDDDPEGMVFEEDSEDDGEAPDLADE